MKILITGGKTATALKLLKAFPDHQILLADYGEMPSIASALYEFEELGVWNEEIAAHHLLTKCLDVGADALIPLYEGEITALAKSLVLFEEFGLQVFVPEPTQLSSVSKPAVSKNWCVFKNGKCLYTNMEDQNMSTIENKHKLNGVYYFDAVNEEFTIIQLPNPA